MMKALFGADAEIAARRREPFLRGIRAIAPALVATGAWGLVTGVAMIQSGLTAVQALAMTLLVYAGSAQLTALPLLAASAPLSVIFLTAAVVNLRFVIFSAALQPYFAHFPVLRRALLGYFATDVGFAMFLSRYGDVAPAERGSQEQLWFFLGMASGIWVAWQSMSILGIALAAKVPATWGLDFAAILGLIAMTIPMIAGRPSIVGAVAAGVVAVLTAGLPLKLGLVAAVVCGIAAAMGAEMLLERREGHR
jgi:predicted branched-subunit amino acid permease